jgi:transcriptional regulator with XRE-family HTH domain
LKLPPLKLSDESLGKRVARLRKERGITQVELAKRIGIIQSMVSAYEHDNLRLSAEMAMRFALALGISVEELLSTKNSPHPFRKPSRKVMRRMEQIEKLPPRKQEFVLQALDSLLRGAGVAV